MKRITSRIWERQTSYNLELGQTFRLVKHLKLNEKFVYIFPVRGIRAFNKNFYVSSVRILGRGVQDGGNTCIPVAGSCCCMAKTITIL